MFKAGLLQKGNGRITGDALAAGRLTLHCEGVYCTGGAMKHVLVSSLMFFTVAVFIAGRVTGFLRFADLNPLSRLGLMLVLFVVSAAFYAVTITKLIHFLIDYQPNPLNIAIYVAGMLAAAYAAWLTTERLTRE